VDLRTSPRRLPRRHFLAGSLAVTGSGGLVARDLTGRQSAAPKAADETDRTPRRFSHPGLMDLQVNGFKGVDFNDPVTSSDRVLEAIAAMRAVGVTRLLPTLISAPLDRFTRCARAITAARSAAIAGIHMEGPYISPEDGARGAHRREDVFPASIDDFKRRHEATDGTVRIVTVAPEVPGVLPLIEYLRTQHIVVSIGHTAATPEQVREAIRAGATLSTHLGNGCAQMLPRHPNFIWEQLAADELVADFIVDGHHLPPATVKVMVRAKTPKRSVLVTDATAAAGQPPGDYKLGALTVHVDDTGRVAVPGQPNLAGSALSLDRAVGNVARFAGISVEEALAMASTQPAAVVGMTPAGTMDVEWDPVRSIIRVLRVAD
jgi:N-acetylglucosamine-6-phosphate deacetylase